MKSIAIIAFTRTGSRLACRLAAGLSALPAYAQARFSLFAPERICAGAAASPNRELPAAHLLAGRPGETPAACGLPHEGRMHREGGSEKGCLSHAAATEPPIEAFSQLEAWTAEHVRVEDALVFVGAAGIAVRAIAPHVDDKLADPAVVAIDEAGAFVTPLLSGHVGGANDLARAIAAVCGARAAISTATDINGVFAVDEWAARNGYSLVERELAKKVSARLLEGLPVGLHLAAGMEVSGPLPPGIVPGPADLGICVSSDIHELPFPETLHAVFRNLTVGVGCRRGVEPSVLAHAVEAALAAIGATRHQVAAFASIDVKGDEPALVQVAREYRCALRLHSAEELAAVPGGFSRSDFVERTVGVDNVCERAACAAGERLVAGKRAGDGVTVAIAALAGGGGRSVSFGYGPEGAMPVRSGHPACGAGRTGGSLCVVGIGPGGGRDMTLRAHDALRACDLIVGYPVYVNLIRDDFPDKEVFTTPMRKEVQRCRAALEHAAAGRKVALVCSGDPGVYGMVGLVLELASAYGNIPVEVVPGVSASNGGAAIVGAPLMHDHCLISLSDALTPWSYIERRLEAAAQAGFCIVLYNPASRTRPGHLRRACGILLRHLPAETVCATVANIGRAGQESRILPLRELADAPADMFTTVFVGNRTTRVLDGRMVTPRGYQVEGG